MKLGPRRYRPTTMKSVPEKLHDVILKSVEKKLDAGEKKISMSDIFTGLETVKLTDDETKIAGTVGKEGLEKAGDTQLKRLSKALKEAGISIVNDGQDIDPKSLSVIQALSAGRDVRAELEVGITNRTIDRQSVQAKGEEIKVAGATPSTSTKKKPRARDLIAKIEKAKTLEDLGALVPDDEKRITVLRARDDRRGEIKKAQGEEIKVAGAILTVKKGKPDEVRVAKPEDKKEFEEAAEEAAEEVVPSKETEDKIEKTSTPVEDLAPKEKEQAKKSIKPEDVTVLIDSKTIDDVVKAVMDAYKEQEGIKGQQYKITEKDAKESVTKVLRSLLDPENTKILKALVDGEFKQYGPIPTKKLVGIVNNSLNISLDGEEEEVEDEEEIKVPDFMSRLDAILAGGSSKDTDNVKEIPALEPALQETKTVQDYINESHEDKFNKLLKAFTK